MRKLIQILLPILVLSAAAGVANAQSFRVQCPTSTPSHPDPSNTEPAYNSPTAYTLDPVGQFLKPSANINGAIKCQQVAGGDGFATMGDGTQTYMFSFGPLSGLADIANGKPGTQFPAVFNTPYATYIGSTTTFLQPGDPATTNDNGGNFTWNGAVGITPDLDCIAGNAAAVAASTPLPCPNLPTSGIDGHVDTRQIMDIGVMNGNIPAPLMAIDEDDEFFLTLTNVGMIQRPDLFEQHTIHFHGYPNASSFYDGVPDASVAINIGGSFTYYYLAPDAGTYFWHCHITPPEHLQMGMVGQIYVRPRQNRVPPTQSLYTYLGYQNGIGLPSGVTADLRTACNPTYDILCSALMPQTPNTVKRTATGALCSGVTAGNPDQVSKYVYNDGDGMSCYDVEYPLQMHGFDPNFHFVGMTFNPEGFTDMKDKYFLLNGRSYPDTATAGPMQTQSTDNSTHFSQPLSAIINIPAGGKALLRISNLSVSEYHTLASLGIPMHVVGYNAKLLRDQAGINTDYYSNSITLGGGESLDVILDATSYAAGQRFFLFTPNLDHLSNDEENFGGIMTVVNVCTSVDQANNTTSGCPTN